MHLLPCSIMMKIKEYCELNSELKVHNGEISK